MVDVARPAKRLCPVCTMDSGRWTYSCYRTISHSSLILHDGGFAFSLLSSDPDHNPHKSVQLHKHAPKPRIPLKLRSGPWMGLVCPADAPFPLQLRCEHSVYSRLIPSCLRSIGTSRCLTMSFKQQMCLDQPSAPHSQELQLLYIWVANVLGWLVN